MPGCLGRCFAKCICGCCQASNVQGAESLKPRQLRDAEEKQISDETLQLMQFLEGIKLAARTESHLHRDDWKQEKSGLESKHENMDQTPLTNDILDVPARYFNISSPSPKRGNKIILKDYCPGVFARIRRREGIPTSSYVQSWAFDPLEIKPPKIGAGRSGSLFAFSRKRPGGECRFIMKTIPWNEAETLRDIIRDYDAHLAKYPDSRLMRFYALQRYQVKQNYIYIVVGNNSFYSPMGLKMTSKFDLKGRVRKHDGPEEANKGVWKDNQLSRRFDPMFVALITQIAVVTLRIIMAVIPDNLINFKQSDNKFMTGDVANPLHLCCT
jgi:hypothetical protein